MSPIRYQYLNVARLFLLGVLCLAYLAHAPAAAASGATLVQTINTGAGGTWGPKYSPDPAGISYWPAKNRLLIADSEVDEMTIWAGANVFESTLDGVRGTTYDTTSFTKEPAGIDIDVAPNGHFWISDDGKMRVFDISLGNDGQFRTGDDTIRTISVGFDSDPEGLTLATIGGETQLFLADGKGQKIWRCRFGANGRFDGGGDDIITSFDVLSIGIKDPEGLDFDSSRGTLWIIDHLGKKLNEVTVTGNLIQTVDLAALANALTPADVTVAPGSTGGTSLYIVDRGVDNNDNPNENDGKIYEIKPPSADTTPPNVTQRAPAPNATNVPVTTNVTATFSEQVTGVEEGFTLSGPGNTAVPATVTYNASTRTATLDPNANLDPNTAYTARLDASIADSAGNHLAQTTWSFTTASNTGANMLQNPGFEDDTNGDGKPDIWSTNNKFTRSNQVVRSGTYAGKFFATNDSGVSIKQLVLGISAGAAYNLSGWVNVPVTSDAFTFKIKIQWLNSSGGTIKTVTAATFSDDTGDNWIQAVKSLTAPAGTASAYVILNPASLNGTIYVDDFELKP